MNVLDILKYGDATWMNAIDTCPDEHIEESGACGWWSVKDIIAHMSDNEIFLEEVLTNFVSGDPIPRLKKWEQHGAKLNDVEVQNRQGMSAAEVIAEYQAAHARVMVLAGQISAEAYRENGTMPWYGADYCLDDLIVYTNYAHKREHAGQIDVFRDQVTAEQ